MNEWQKRPHYFQPDGIENLFGDQACTCGLPKTNRLHKIKPTDADVKEAESRRLGEKDNE